MNSLRIMGKRGDDHIPFDPKNKEATLVASRLFDKYRGQGYLAYQPDTGADGASEGALVKEFDPEAELTVLIPPIMGG